VIERPLSNQPGESAERDPRGNERRCEPRVQGAVGGGDPGGRTGRLLDSSRRRWRN
jgi:hypothetical protein